MTKHNLRTKNISLTIIFTSTALILEILPLDIPFPLFSKLTLDVTGVPLLLTFYLVDLPSTIVAVLFIGLAIALPRPPFRPPNPYGGFFKVVAELSTILGIWLTKRFWKGSRMRFLSLSIVGGSISRVVIMSFVNYVFLPLFYGLPRSIVLKIIPVVAVFNLIQSVVNVVLAYVCLESVKERLSLNYLE